MPHLSWKKQLRAAYDDDREACLRTIDTVLNGSFSFSKYIQPPQPLLSQAQEMRIAKAVPIKTEKARRGGRTRKLSPRARTMEGPPPKDPNRIAAAMYEQLVLPPSRPQPSDFCPSTPQMETARGIRAVSEGRLQPEAVPGHAHVITDLHRRLQQCIERIGYDSGEEDDEDAEMPGN